MQIKLHYILIVAIGVLATACKKDNYDEPGSKLSGRLTYQGQEIGVQRNDVPFELYQFGFGKVAPIRATFAQDGTYSALLFDGEYKLIIPNGQGPFLWPKTAAGAPDTVTVNLKGAQTLDLEVTPFYMIKSPQVTGSGGKVNASFSVQKVITDANARDIENVGLYINKTMFVSPGDNIANATLGGTAITDPNNIRLEVSVPNIVPAQDYVFARIGLKIAGVEDRIFSPLVKVKF